MPAHDATLGTDETERVAVLLPLPFDDVYDYRVPEDMMAPLGTFVRVPFGRREAIGVVWGEGRGDIAADRLKDLSDVLDTPTMTDPLRALVDWVAAYKIGRAHV